MEPDKKRPHLARNSPFDSNGLSVKIPPRNIAHTTPDQIFKFTFDNMKKSSTPSPRSAPTSDGSNRGKFNTLLDNNDNNHGSDMIFYYPSQSSNMGSVHSSAKSLQSTPFSYNLLPDGFHQSQNSTPTSFPGKLSSTPGNYSLNDLLSPQIMMLQAPHNQQAMFSLLQNHDQVSMDESMSVPQTPSSAIETPPLQTPTMLLDNELREATDNHNSGDDGKKVKRTRTVKLDADTVIWLKANFEMYPGRTVERSTVYQAYVKHMETLMKSPCNSAGFGKTMRTVFKGVQSRRLGARGQSRYHYDGVRIKPSSAIAMLEMAQEGERMIHGSENNNGEKEQSGDPSGGSNDAKKSQYRDPSLSAAALMMLARSVDKKLSLPAFPPLTKEDFSSEDVPLQLSSSLAEKSYKLTESYLKHCNDVLNSIKNVHFSHAYATIHSFWEAFPTELSALLPFEATAMKIQLWDTILYDTIIHVVIPEVLRPLGKNAKTCVKSLCDDIVSSVKALPGNTKLHVPANIVNAKVTASSVCKDILDRRLSLNNLARVGIKLLESDMQMKGMAEDIAKMNLRSIKRQSQWVTACDEDFVEDIMKEFSTFLSTSRSLGLASEWLDGIVRRCFKEYARVDVDELARGEVTPLAHTSDTTFSSSDESSEESDAETSSEYKHHSQRTRQEKIAALHKCGRKFLLAWNFYTSQIIRDFSLRSASTFGTANILRLLFDEYMNYLVHTRITHPHKPIAHPKIIVKSE
eukprot:m.65778 g.65778  ORF g.65778 m.65778 type:complete len:744 (-) comp8165_c2_seq1:117-2348(-)